MKMPKILLSSILLSVLVTKSALAMVEIHVYNITSRYGDNGMPLVFNGCSGYTTYSLAIGSLLTANSNATISVKMSAIPESKPLVCEFEIPAHYIPLAGDYKVRFGVNTADCGFLRAYPKHTHKMFAQGFRDSSGCDVNLYRVSSQ